MKPDHSWTPRAAHCYPRTLTAWNARVSRACLRTQLPGRISDRGGRAYPFERLAVAAGSVVGWLTFEGFRHLRRGAQMEFDLSPCAPNSDLRTAISDSSSP